MDYCILYSEAAVAVFYFRVSISKRNNVGGKLVQIQIIENSTQ